MNRLKFLAILLLPVRARLGNHWRLFTALPIIVLGGVGAGASMFTESDEDTRRILTIAERVEHQRRVEEVYWRHRTEAAGQPRVAFTEAVPEAAIRIKAEDTLRKSAALAELWQRPITSEQLQAEIARMAAHTRQPDVLRELFAALDNDPHVIAESLARPLLVEREMQAYYARDERFHGALRARVTAEMQARANAPFNTLSGKYSERQLLHPAAMTQTEKSAVDAENRAAVLSDNEWQQMLSQLEKAFAVRPASTSDPVRGSTIDRARADNFPIARISSLQESDTEFYVVSVLAASANQLTLAIVSWPKEPFDVWWQEARNNFPLAEAGAASAKAFQLPAIDSSSPGVNNTWQPTTAPLSPRENHTAVWTGSEMIVWGGFYNPSGYDDFAVTVASRYNPATDSWHLSSVTNAPTWRERHTAVWTGTEMIVWGGYTGVGGETNTGARYNPATNTWTPTSTTNAPQTRSRHVAVWTGSRMIVWGGRTGFSENTTVNTGGIYDPASNTWTPTSTINAPAPRSYHSAVWTGTEMIVWGGYNGTSQVLNTGGRYNPQTNSWVQTTTSGAPTPRFAHNAIWTGTRMLIWAGASDFFVPTFFNNGALYNPVANTWTPMTTAGAPIPRDAAAAIWTGSEMLVWGGYNGDRLRNGGRYNPQTNIWQTLSTTGAPEGAVLMSAVWTGTEMIVWGGQEPTLAGDVNTGARYNPQTNSWLPVTNPQNAGARTEHAAVWTGSEMIVWGSYGPFGEPTNTGSRYYPSTDSWLPTSMTNVPSGRYSPLAVWSGSRMIVWGGCTDGFCHTRLNTGGRYNPATNSWQATSTVGAAEPRYWFTAIWTGTEMMVWGGCNAQVCGPGGERNGLNNGGRYNPQTDSWQPISLTGPPSGRWLHTAVWSGSEMIVWGGINGTVGPFDTGGRYNAATNTWTPTSTTNVPTARGIHRAVWTGSRMLIWGGFNSLLDQYLNTGGVYNPSNNTWTATTLTGAPAPRDGHSMIWTGTEAIVWGGCNEVNCQNGLSSGGRYNPQSNSWQTTTNIEAPSPRTLHTAVWTGAEMIVFGGEPCARCVPLFDTGGRYAATGGPTPTPTPTATPTPTPISVQATVRTNLLGRTFTVDGVTYNSTQTFSWTSGSTHTIATTSPQSGGTGIRYVWTRWSDNGAISHTVAPTINTTYTANFRTQYQLTMRAGTGGTVRPASGWRNRGATVSISAIPAAGYSFSNWTGSGNGSYSGTNNPASIIMAGPITETAKFIHNN